MSANRTIPIIGLPLVLIAVLAATGPALAHPGERLRPTSAPAPRAPAAETPPAAAAVTPEDHSVPESPGLTPLIAAVVLLLAGLLLRRRSSRRTLVLSLVLLLTLFAFEP